MNLMNSSYSGECLNNGTYFSRVGLFAYLSCFVFELWSYLVAGTVPMRRLGGLQFLNDWEYYWKSN